MQTTRRKFILTAAGGSLGALAAVPGAAAQSAKTDGHDPGVLVIPERQVPVLAEADVVVCGGGTAGISAACCAARHGAKVVLLERWPSLGGMATNALVNIWHTSDRTKQVIFGFVQEAVERAGDFIHRYPDFPKRPETHWFDPKGSGYTTWTDQQKDLMPPVGDSYHIPLGMGLNDQLPNLAVVGRCASSTHEAHASVRLQSHCMVMGQGLGTCAALALGAGVDMAQFDIRKLQTQLRKDGVYLENVP